MKDPRTELVRLIKIEGWTQANFAKRMDYSPSYIGDILKQRRGISLQFAVKLDSILDCPNNNYESWWTFWNQYLLWKTYFKKRRKVR